MKEIRDLRTAIGLTQKEFAQKFSIPFRTVQLWESDKGNPPEYVVALIKSQIQRELDEKEEKYPEQVATITCTESQLALIRTALEDYARLRMGQELYMADSLVWDGYKYKPEDPEYDKRIEARSELEVKFREIASIMNMFGRSKSEETENAIDIWRVIRHEEYLNSPNKDKIGWDVRSNIPRQYGTERLAKCKIRK